MAGAKITVKIEGGKELQDALRRVSASVAGEHLTAAAKEGAEIVRAEASRRAPRRTGKLAANIIAEVSLSQSDRAEISVGPSKEAFYGMFVELGTKHMAPRPYLRPAIDESRAEVERAVHEALRRRLLGAVR